MPEITKFRRKDAYSYFRMGLVTGIVDRQALVEWADHEIVRNSATDEAIIELSLSGNRPYSEIIWLLHDYERGADYSLALKLLLARAGTLLTTNPGHAGKIIMGLRLLNEEEYFPQEMRVRIANLMNGLEKCRRGAISPIELLEQLSGFLGEYAAYAGLLEHTVHPIFDDSAPPVDSTTMLG